MKSLIPRLLLSAISTLALSAQAENIEASCSPYFETSNAFLNRAVQNLRGLGYTRHALKAATKNLKDPRICVSGAPLSLSDHLYYNFLLRADVYEGEESTPRNRFNFLFQDASTQAHHNVGGKIWVGLDTVDVQNLLVEALRSTEIERTIPAETTDLATLAKTSPVYQQIAGQVDSDTFSILEVYSDKNLAGYVVTFMTKLPEDNPFAGKPITKGFFMELENASSGEIKAGRALYTVSYSESIDVQSTIANPLREALNKNAQRYLSGNEKAAEILVDLSQPE